MIMGSLPVFLNVNSQVASGPSGTVPNSWLRSVNAISSALSVVAGVVVAGGVTGVVVLTESPVSLCFLCWAIANPVVNNNNPNDRISFFMLRFFFALKLVL